MVHLHALLAPQVSIHYQVQVAAQRLVQQVIRALTACKAHVLQVHGLKRVLEAAAPAWQGMLVLTVP